MSKQKFNTGQIVSTRGVVDMCEKYPEMGNFVADSMRKHITGDWGDLTIDDKLLNDDALWVEDPQRILSSYNFQQLPGISDTKIWIITQ